MTIPQYEGLSTSRMSQIFTNTAATYKFYWFIGILDLFIKKGMTRMTIWDVIIEMVANAWNPACNFHLTFGKSEELYKAIFKLHRKYEIAENISPSDLSQWLHEHLDDRKVQAILRPIQAVVPYRFLRPWINTCDKILITERSMEFENGCPYRLNRIEGMLWIELNEEWLSYFQTNYSILKDFAYWNLTLFLQPRNPNVPNIPNKLIMTEGRNSLEKQHDYWDFVINHGCKIRCIYTNKPLETDDYALDHFIPWSFVSHDLIWNLLPVDGGINSSKRDKLPKLDEYLPKLAHNQQMAVKICLASNFKGTILEDYLFLGCTPQELADMDELHLLDCFNKTYRPMNQIAQNMGFEVWRY